LTIENGTRLLHGEQFTGTSIEMHNEKDIQEEINYREGIRYGKAKAILRMGFGF